jgi:hypothetical protein
MIHGSSGLVLVELLAALVLGGIVLGAVIALLHTHGVLARRSQEALGAAGAAAWAEAIAVRDVQLAGADPMRVGIAPLVAADAGRLVLQSDANGDGEIDPSSAERVTLRWSASSGGLFVRALGGQSMALADGVRAGGLRFRYFTADGTEIGPPAEGVALGQDELDRICRVVIELVVTPPSTRGEERVGLVAGAGLRSCAWTDA